MSVRDRVDRIIELLREAQLDDARWPAASALIDDLCGLEGNDLLLGRLTPQRGIDIELRWLFLRGDPRPELQREYVEHYAAIDERPVAGIREPFGKLVHTNALMTDRVRRTSTTYNDYLVPNAGENCLNVRLPVDGDLQMAWSLVGPGGGTPGDWTGGQVDAIRQVLPHVRQFVRVRHALAEARAEGMATAALLDTRRIGMLLLDRAGRVVEANDRARAMLARGEGLAVRDGRLVGVTPADPVQVARLLAAACQGRDGSLPIARPARDPLVLHATPRTPVGTSRGVVRVLLAEPFSTSPINAAHVAAALGLTPGQGVVAAALAGGATVASIAAASHRSEAAVRWHIRQALQRLGLSRQADLVRVVLSTPGIFVEDY
ncbi:MAG: hypothetical protein OXH15_22885 [Gammaproteobacteria bacterium]|nr:hypothetical protein [Gammaproteobacteria bacterium]